MRFVLALAATTALWAQPAQAATYLWVGECCYLNPIIQTMTVHDATPGAAIAALPGSSPSYELLGFAGVNGEFILDTPLTVKNWNSYGYNATRIAAFDPDNIGTFNNKWQIGSISNVSISGDPAPGVPEPSTWGLMVLGFGVVGTGMRSAHRRKSAVSFA